MSFLDRFRAPKADPVSRVEPPVIAGASATSSGVSNPAPWLQQISSWGPQTRVKSLPHVTELGAQKHATVFACCNVIAGDLAKVPLQVRQRQTLDAPGPVVDHPLNYLLNVEASPGIPAKVMRFATTYAFCLRGRSYAYAPRDGGGEVILIDIIRQELVSELIAGRARFYDFMDGSLTYRRCSNRSMVHLRYMAPDGWIGRSPIMVAAESIGLALAGQEAAARAASGVQMRAYAKLEDVWADDETYRRNARRIRAALMDPEANGIPIIGASDDIGSLDLSAADQQLLESRKFDREQIAAIYRVPPSKLQMLEHSVKSTTQQQAIDYKADCLLHWGGFVENGMTQGLLSDGERRKGLYLAHDYDALMQATTKERYEAEVAAVGGPVKTPDEGRASLGLAPLPNGDGAKINPAPNMTRKPDSTPAPSNGKGTE